MASILISEAEKVYVLHGVQEDVRVDGRGRKDVRPIVLESGLVNIFANAPVQLRVSQSTLQSTF
jgi:exosome complex component RRP42